MAKCIKPKERPNGSIMTLLFTPFFQVHGRIGVAVTGAVKEEERAEFPRTTRDSYSRLQDRARKKYKEGNKNEKKGGER